jgi:hypothetical protein
VAGEIARQSTLRIATGPQVQNARIDALPLGRLSHIFEPNRWAHAIRSDQGQHGWTWYRGTGRRPSTGAWGLKEPARGSPAAVPSLLAGPARSQPICPCYGGGHPRRDRHGIIAARRCLVVVASKAAAAGITVSEFQGNYVVLRIVIGCSDAAFGATMGVKDCL